MKLHANSAISEIKSRYMCMDVKGFLPEQSDGSSRIHHDTDIHDPKIIIRRIQPQGQGTQ